MRRVCSIGLVFYLLYLGAVTLAPFDFQFGSQLHRWERSIALSPPDVAANILLFIPLGGLLYGLLPAGRKEPRLIGVLLFSGVVSLTVESLQLFLPERFSSFSDLLVNTIGGGVGFLLFKAMEDRGWLRQIWRYRGGLVRLAFLLYVGFLFFLAVFSWERLDRWEPNALLWVGTGPDREDAWKGKIYLLAVYDRALDPEAIQRHYRAGFSFRPEIHLQENPLALYSFDERQGTTLHDRSGVLPPLDLKLSNSGRGRWLAPSGYAFNQSGSFVSSAPAEKIRQRISATSRFTLEAWVEEAPLRYGDLGRLISLARSPDADYLVLQQQGEDLAFVIRNRSKTGYPYWGKIETTQMRVPQGLAHLVAVYDQGQARLYVNGIEAADAVFTDGFFLLTNSFVFRATNEEERGFLGFLLFLPLGVLAILSARIPPTTGRLLGLILFSEMILAAVHWVQGRHTPVFFTGGSLLVAALAILMGALIGWFTQGSRPDFSED